MSSSSGWDDLPPRIHRLLPRRAERDRNAVALIKTTDPAGGIYPALLMGWEGLLQGMVDVYELPGEHLQMLLEPAVDRVAEVLRQRLKAAASPTD